MMTARRFMAITLLVVATLALLWLLLHLWPTHDETAEAATAQASVTREQAHALRRGYYLYHTGHPRAAHKALKQGYKSYFRIPRHHNVYRIDGPFRLRGEQCRNAEWSNVTSADIVGKRLYSVTYVQRFCWGRRHGRHVVTDVGRLHSRQDISGFGEFLNWSAEGVTDTSHGWCVLHVCHVSTKEVRFHQCTPSGLIGCIFPRDKDVWGWMYTYGNGESRLDA